MRAGYFRPRVAAGHSPGADVVNARILRRRIYSRGVLIAVAASFPLAFALGYLIHPNF